MSENHTLYDHLISPTYLDSFVKHKKLLKKSGSNWQKKPGALCFFFFTHFTEVPPHGELTEPKALPLHIQMVLLERLAEQRLKNARTPEQQEARLRCCELLIFFRFLAKKLKIY